MRAALSDRALRESPFLSDLKERFPDAASLEDILSSVPSATAIDLLSLKAQFALAFAQHQFSDFDEMGQTWTQFADATISRALMLAWEGAAKAHKLTLSPNASNGLFILGLGKLGGYDLNFSSDVDLIAYYDAETLPVPEHKGQSYIASDVCKRMTQILQPRNSPNFVWRVDWRLRPESSGTGLAISTAKAETFYFFRALPWHRLAMMKARVVAGDTSAGEDFLDQLEPFIWRRNLDYRTLDELAALKTRINDEHPGLKSERAAPEPITAQASGFNLKLGRGGIREIEFIANAQQLIHGGKRPALRVTNTRAAILRLSETELLSEEDARILRDDYVFFREAENAVQMYRNEQTHILPARDTLTSITTLLGSPNELDRDIHTRRQRVHAHFNSLFNEPTKAARVADFANLDGNASDIAKHWSEGFTDHGLPPMSRGKFQDLGCTLIDRVQRLNRPDAFERIDHFLKRIGRSEQYFSLLSRSPDLLDALITPLIHSPHMSEILRQSPHIIDIFLSPDDASLSEQSQFVLTSPDYGRRLEALRRFVNEQLFYAYTQFLESRWPAGRLQTQLTNIAETTLELAIKIVADDLDVDHIPMTVLGLGKMGTSAMAPQSDLDLIFLFADGCDPELSAKTIRRLRTTLTTKLSEGIAYELDMRLRPSGRSGPPAVKLSAFHHHHMTRAHSWEHIALAPARIVAGNQALGAEVMEIKNDILSRPRNAEAFKIDALAMLSRLRDERLQLTPPDVWRTKLRTGGLMQADYMQACLTVLGEDAPADLIDATQHWNEIVITERLLGLTGESVTQTPEQFSKLVKQQELPEKNAIAEQAVNSLTSAFFEDIAKLTPAEPRPIIWDS